MGIPGKNVVANNEDLVISIGINIHSKVSTIPVDRVKCSVYHGNLACACTVATRTRWGCGHDWAAVVHPLIAVFPGLTQDTDPDTRAAADPLHARSASAYARNQ
jgi:hypothetical protein